MLLLTFVYILQDLGYYKHLVNLIACVSTGDPICLITEFCEKGDLLHLLRAEKDNIINVGHDLLRITDYMLLIVESIIILTMYHEKCHCSQYHIASNSQSSRKQLYHFRIQQTDF